MSSFPLVEAATSEIHIYLQVVYVLKDAKHSSTKGGFLLAYNGDTLRYVCAKLEGKLLKMCQ